MRVHQCYQRELHAELPALAVEIEAQDPLRLLYEKLNRQEMDIVSVRVGPRASDHTLNGSVADNCLALHIHDRNHCT